MIPIGLHPSYLAALSPSSTATSTKNQNSDFQNLMQSLQSGNLSGAQQAFAALTQEMGSSSQTGSSASAGSTFSQDLSAVGQALQSGNMSAAQQAFAKLQQDAQGAGGVSGHHYHHHRGPQPMGPASTASGSAASGVLSSTGSINTSA